MAIVSVGRANKVSRVKHRLKQRPENVIHLFRVISAIRPVERHAASKIFRNHFHAWKDSAASFACEHRLMPCLKFPNPVRRRNA